MLSESQREEAAAILARAAENRIQAPRPSERWPEMEIADSYAISALMAARRSASGARLIGHKVGLTSRAMQRSSKIDEPDYGHIFDDMLLENGAVVAFSDFCVPRVEPELTFVLKSRLEGPGVTLIDVLNATDHVLPSIEIIDARVEEPRRITDTVADNGAAAGLVLGGRPVRPDAVDLTRIGAAFYRNSAIEETGLAVGVLGHPALAVAWLANRLAGFGVALEAGHMVLTGAFTRPVWAAAGDTLHADFGDLGQVAVSFT